MSPRPDVSNERKSQILDAALGVFARLGFERARVDDIVKASGLSKGALYWYFESKDAIIVGILDRVFGGSSLALDQLMNDEGPVPDRLRRLSTRVVEDVERSQAIIPITFEFYAVAMRSKTVHRFLQDYYARYLAGLSKVLELGIERGEIRKTDPDVAALSLIALIEGLILLWVMDATRLDPGKALAAAAEDFIQGLETKKPRRPARRTSKEKK